MSAEINNFNYKLCEERHENIEKEFDLMWKRMNGTEKKLWAILLLLVANLAGLIVTLMKIH